MSRRNRAATRKSNARTPKLEALEQRSTPSISSVVLLANGNLQISCNNNMTNARAYLSGSNLIVRDLSPARQWVFSAGAVKQMTFLGGLNADRFEHSLNKPITAYGYAGNDRFVTGSGNDVLDGGGDNDQLQGGGGNDTLRGGAGNDSLAAGDGNDIGYGGAGNDNLAGGNGQDTLVGEAGNDTIDGVAGNDVIYGGDGNDALYGNTGNDILDGGNGNDTLDGYSGVDTLRGGAGDDTLRGGGDGDYLYGDAGNDVLRGETGNDLLEGGDGNDELWGDLGNDVLRGDAGNDFVCGGHDTDSVYGGAGDDGVFGGVENPDRPDLLYGEAGNDRFLTRETNDTMVDKGSNDVQIRIWDGRDWQRFDTQMWDERQVRVLDQAFAELQARAGTTRILKDTEYDDPLTFLCARPGYSWAGMNATEWDVTGFHMQRSIYISPWDPANSSMNRSRRSTVIHEIGHNWDETDEADHHPEGSDLLSAFLHLNAISDAPDDFAEPYGMTNAKEDWATCWERSLGYGGTAASPILRAKLAVLDAFFSTFN